MESAMHLEDIWYLLAQTTFSIPSLDRGNHPVFNQYSDIEPTIDLPDADSIRRQNLKHYLLSFPSRPPTLLVGEAAGWRGCRFSGIPFTSERQLASGELPFHGAPSSTRIFPHAEATATIFWEVLNPHHPSFLAWNCIPVHPYQPGRKMSNRTPIQSELEAFQPQLKELVKLLAPKIVIAVGKRAGASLTRLGINHIPARHPSHGGAKAFQAQVISVFANA